MRRACTKPAHIQIVSIEIVDQLMSDSWSFNASQGRMKRQDDAEADPCQYKGYLTSTRPSLSLLSGVFGPLVGTLCPECIFIGLHHRPHLRRCGKLPGREFIPSWGINRSLLVAMRCSAVLFTPSPPVLSATTTLFAPSYAGPFSRLTRASSA